MLMENFPAVHTRHLLYRPNFYTAIGASLCTLSVLDGVNRSPSSVLLTPLLPAVPFQLSVAHALWHHFENLQLFSVIRGFCACIVVMDNKASLPYEPSKFSEKITWCTVQKKETFLGQNLEDLKACLKSVTCWGT